MKISHVNLPQIQTCKKVLTANSVSQKVLKNAECNKVLKTQGLDFSTEERGYFKAGDRIVKMFFPR